MYILLDKKNKNFLFGFQELKSLGPVHGIYVHEKISKDIFKWEYSSNFFSDFSYLTYQIRFCKKWNSGFFYLILISIKIFQNLQKYKYLCYLILFLLSALSFMIFDSNKDIPEVFSLKNWEKILSHGSFSNSVSLKENFFYSPLYPSRESEFFYILPVLGSESGGYFYLAVPNSRVFGLSKNEKSYVYRPYFSCFQKNGIQLNFFRIPTETKFIFFLSKEFISYENRYFYSFLHEDQSRDIYCESRK